MININWTTIKRKPPIIPKYIHVCPNEPSGMKNAPIMPPITTRNLRAQNLKQIKKMFVKKSAFLTLKKSIENE